MKRPSTCGANNAKRGFSFEIRSACPSCVQYIPSILEDDNLSETANPIDDNVGRQLTVISLQRENIENNLQRVFFFPPAPPHFLWVATRYMSSDAEKLLIRVGLPQYTGRLIAANMSTFTSLQAKKAMIPAIIPNADHAKRIVEALGLRGTQVYQDAAVSDPVEDALEQWDTQIRARLRKLAERQAAALQTRIPLVRASSSSSGSSTTTATSKKVNSHDLVAKIEHCKALLASVHCGKRVHRKWTELTKLLEKYRNKAGDPKDVESAKQQLEENGSYVRKILVMLEEEGKLVMPADGSADSGDDMNADAEVPNESGRSSKRPARPSSSRTKSTQPQQPTASNSSNSSPDVIRSAAMDSLWQAALLVHLNQKIFSVQMAESDSRRLLEQEVLDAMTECVNQSSLVLRCLLPTSTTGM